MLKAGIAHLCFVTIHPFEDGNGRIARALTDLAAARGPNTARNVSTACRRRSGEERNDYYRFLETTQKGDLDITPWLDWFLGCLGRSFEGADTILAAIMAKAPFLGKPFRHRAE